MEAISSSETWVLKRVTRRHIHEDGSLRIHRHENLKYFIALKGWYQQRRRNLSPVRYELDFYITEYDINHSHVRENLKSLIGLTG
jgi:hypothetical protein